MIKKFEQFEFIEDWEEEEPPKLFISKYRGIGIYDNYSYNGCRYLLYQMESDGTTKVL